MKFQIITIFPQMFESLRQDGVVGQAIKRGLIELEIVNPRDFTPDLHRSVDDRPFGGGDGMVMMPEPLEKAIKSLSKPGRVLATSPQGGLLTDAKVQELAKMPVLTLICGRYAGVDQRILNHYVDEEISIGDFVLSGGELAAQVIIDSVSRFIPGVLGHEDSAQKDSLTQGHFEAPLFTKPREFLGQSVPDILLSGHHEKIQEWRLVVGLLKTLQKRPETLKPMELPPKKKLRLLELARALTTDERTSLDLQNFDFENLKRYLEGRSHE